MPVVGVLLLFGLVFGGFVGLVVLLLVGQQHATRRRREAWARLANGLGLSLAGDTIWGTLDGARVRVWIRVVRHNKSTSYYTVVEGQLEPHLDAGLSVYAQGIFGDVLGGFLGQRDVEVGHAELDRLFVVRADEDQRARWLLPPALCDAMVALKRSRHEFCLDDAGARVERNGITSDEAWLAWALRTAAGLTRQLDDARRRTPPATPLLPHRLAWQRFARSAGLRGMDTPLCMWGRLDGASVGAYAVRTRPLEYRIEATVRFDEPLALGLAVRPEGSWDSLRALFGAQDVSLGDPTFDRAFVVRATDLHRLDAVLDGDVRRSMVDLGQRVGPLQIDDEAVRLQSSSLSHDPRQAPWLLETAKQLADRIAANARPDAQRGPYR